MVIYDKQSWKNKPNDKQAQGLDDFGMNPARLQRLCVSLCQWNAITATDIFIKRKEYSYDRCPNPVYFKIHLIIIYLSAIETLICHTEIEVNRVYFLQFCTKYLT